MQVWIEELSFKNQTTQSTHRLRKANGPLSCWPKKIEDAALLKPRRLVRSVITEDFSGMIEKQ